MGISTHILDTAKGKPAARVSIVLERREASGEFVELGRGLTDNDRLTFDTGGYFAQSGERCFYPSVTVLFEILDPAQHYHVPILLSAYGYSTYRGS
jgi:5-hydroxyisourate hydrolase